MTSSLELASLQSRHRALPWEAHTQETSHASVLFHQSGPPRYPSSCSPDLLSNGDFIVLKRQKSISRWHSQNTLLSALEYLQRKHFRRAHSLKLPSGPAIPRGGTRPEDLAAGLEPTCTTASSAAARRGGARAPILGGTDQRHGVWPGSGCRSAPKREEMLLTRSQEEPRGRSPR